MDFLTAGRDSRRKPIWSTIRERHPAAVAVTPFFLGGLMERRSVDQNEAAGSLSSGGAIPLAPTKLIRLAS
jgi:hypothetical protein